ncbi:MAG: hypothetical protein IT559_02640 [Alphaproteobacteria bacterium]|nr:hypothetical protein [Alphaproteobacteria bacterium]
MGLMIHSLDNIPESARRDYFIYLLDYGWDEPISDALRRNFDHMAHQSANNKAVIIKGTVGEHFRNEVFSWHKINGLNAEDILPALLISNNHPLYFRDHEHGEQWGGRLLNESTESDMKLIIIPFRKFCKTKTEVVKLIQEVFKDIKEEKELASFSIAKKMKAGHGHAIADALILEPNIAGIGVNLKKLVESFINKKPA